MSKTVLALEGCVGFIRFSLDGDRRPAVEVTDERYRVLGEWVLVDVTYREASLWALAAIDQVAEAGSAPDGRAGELPDLSGEGYTVTRDPEGLRFTGAMAVGEATYTVEEVRQALEAYYWFWRRQPEPQGTREFRPDLPAWHADLLFWEQRHDRPHPYRDRLFSGRRPLPPPAEVS